LLPRSCGDLSKNTAVAATHFPELPFGEMSRPLCPCSLAASYEVDHKEARDEGDDEKHQRDIQGHGPSERQAPLGSA
jgi:hypothetical protein